ncbi:MAG: glycosyltransferase family 4 protein [Gammaproteobacteria bacterium]|nr:glycosyltransferase family 4 protein [Gammaproteobacteria bacterium]MDH5239642.1 glycosyltransferase family 4 protein [Gammaproteobacteria bacterium]
MRICLFNPAFDRNLDTVECLQATYWHVFRLAEALCDLGHDVAIIQAFAEQGEFVAGRVPTYTVIASTKVPGGKGSTFEVTDYAAGIGLMRHLNPDVVHLFGISLESPLRTIGEWTADAGKVLTISFHGGAPRRNPLARRKQKKNRRAVNAAFFSADSFAREWRDLLPADARIRLAPELSSPFDGKPSREAREQWDIDGGPVFASCGRLHPLKDPLTMLRGFEQILAFAPHASLLMAYQTTELLPEVKAYLADHAEVSARVRLLGRLEHKDVEALFSASDFYLAASHREYGGNALVEALSCGCIPLVTDIPSFRELTRHVPGAGLYAAGNPAALVETARLALDTDIDEACREVKRAFERHLSYAALAKTYSEEFEKL